ncbi:MAG: hypothetical protein IT262_15760 [Saprospiraceae bacterium]|nr:hypothetical protein [Saprospiraceae bacterium]
MFLRNLLAYLYPLKTPPCPQIKHIRRFQAAACRQMPAKAVKPPVKY